MSVGHHLKKKIIQARNRRQQIIMHHVRQHEAGRELAAEQEQKRREAATPEAEPSREGDDVVWTAKTQEIRNKLNNKKRMAKDRWNRYSGTSDGGGRGR